MKVFIITTVIILFIGALTFLTCVIVDRVKMDKKLKSIKTGMTGKQVQNSTGLKVQIISVEEDYYYAKITSPLKFFKYNLVFKDGRLKSIGRI